MRKILEAYEKLFDDAINVGGSPLSTIKRIFSGGFENFTVPRADMPAIQIRGNGSELTDIGIPQSEFQVSLSIHLIYNFDDYTNLTDVPSTKIRRVDTSHTIADLVEKRNDSDDYCKYDKNSLAGIIMNNATVILDGKTVGYNAQIQNIRYANILRWTPGNFFPTGEAIIDVAVYTRTQPDNS